MRIVWEQPLDFLSKLDEAAFDSWLEAIDGVHHIWGLGHLVEFDVTPGGIADDALRELIAIYIRYDGDLADLAQLETDSNRGWLRDASAPWFDAMFGGKGS